MQNNSKTIRQEKALQIWKDNGFNGTFNHAMRFGKTREIEMACERVRINNPDVTIFLLVPTDIAYRNVKHIERDYNVQCFTMRAFTNMLENPTINFGCYLLIIDEVHAFLNDRNSWIIKHIKPKFRLALTGSKLSNYQKGILKNLKMPVIDVITEEEALFNKWITEYEEYNIAISLNQTDAIRYKAFNVAINGVAEQFKGVYKRVNTAFKQELFKNDFDLIQSCHIGKPVLDQKFRKVDFITSDKLIPIVCHLMGYRVDAKIENDYDKVRQVNWNPNNVQNLAKTYHRCIANRNSFIKHNVDKVNAVLALSKVIQKPTIVYNDSNDMTDQLFELLRVPKVRYHSGLESVPMLDDEGNPVLYKSGDKKGEPKIMGKTLLKKVAIESMITGKALYLITGKSLNESLNLPIVQYIICTAGDTNPNTYDQRVGRGKTIDVNNESKRCIIINLFIDDFFLNGEFITSRDKEKLILRQDNVKNVVWLESIDDFISINQKQ